MPAVRPVLVFSEDLPNKASRTSFLSQLRLTTPDNIRRPQILQYVLDAREDHLELLSDDPNYQRLPDDLEMTVCDVNDATAIIGLYSRRARQAYEWNERAGA